MEENLKRKKVEWEVEDGKRAKICLMVVFPFFFG